MNKEAPCGCRAVRYSSIIGPAAEIDSSKCMFDAAISMVNDKAKAVPQKRTFWSAAGYACGLVFIIWFGWVTAFVLIGIGRWSFHFAFK